MKTNNRKLGKQGFKIPIVAIVLIVVGIFLFAIFFKSTSVLASKRLHYIEIDSTVVRHKYKNSRTSAAVVEYTIDNKKYNAITKSSDDKLKPYGSVIKIMYNPTDPKDVVFDSDKVSIFIPIGALLTFSIGIAITIVTFVKEGKKNKKKFSFVEEVPLYKPVNKASNNTSSENSQTIVNEPKNVVNNNNNISLNIGSGVGNVSNIPSSNQTTGLEKNVNAPIKNEDITNTIIKVPYVNNVINPAIQEKTEATNEPEISVTTEKQEIVQEKPLSETEKLRNKLKKQNNTHDNIEVPDFLSK